MITTVNFIFAVAVGAFLVGVVRNLTTHRRAIHPVFELFDPVPYGLVPREQLNAARPGPPPPALRLKEMQAIADSAWEGDWRQAAAYAAGAGQDWDECWSRQELLLEIACSGDTWLEEWRMAQPGNCAAATVEAQLLLHRAWEIRGSEYASRVPADRMARFKELLPAAFEAARRAALLDAHDPGPWVVMITAARAMGYSPERFGPLWEELTARAPHHYTGHWQAMQYWCAKWSGSDQLMLDFTAHAVRHAPPGSALPGIHLHALEELEKRPGAAALLASPAARAPLDTVARALHDVPDDDERLPRLRHLLAHHLLLAGRHDAALEQFRRIGPWCGAAPWTRHPDPAAAFDDARSIAARNSGLNHGR
ncbi:hypothetical protein P3T36_002290 [Kitasatospora sp. MAP12-15]|uniref:hypothetical protein n=1 Tax=unclassified Kitasatospora TaxID=2633591 RepID=UPI0024753A5A|nr:hypothetical protein [Kitasatospora sp. MAP12-44]MDH6108789.1 hypothetical protein [Kitasatospora sp. MAP12-44]